MLNTRENPAEERDVVGVQPFGGRVLAPFRFIKGQSVPCVLASYSPSSCFCSPPVRR